MSYKKSRYTRLTAFRERWDLSQQDLAVLLGYSLATIHRWEAADSVPLWFDTWSHGYERKRTTGDDKLTTLDKIEVPSSRQLVVCPKCSDRRISPLENSDGLPSQEHFGCARCGHSWTVGNKREPFPFNLKPYGG